MANTLKLEIITPDAVVYKDDVHMVTLPGIEGELGIYPLHVPLITQIVPGGIEEIMEDEEAVSASKK